MGDTEYAIGRKAAIEDLKKDIDAAIERVKEEQGAAVVFQLDCSCAFNRTSRQVALSNLAERAPHLLTPIGQWLRLPMTHIILTEEGEPVEIVTTDGLPQGCPSAPLAFSLAMGDPEQEFFTEMAQTGTNPNHFSLRRYMDDITLITAPHIADKCYSALKEALIRAGMKLNEDKCTAWTTDGRPPEDQVSRTLWENAVDHGGFVVCGFPATCEDPAAEAALAFPIGNPNYVEEFLEKRKRAIEELTKRIVNLATTASASTPSVQAFCCLLRGCILQKIGHLLRIIPPEYTSGITTHLDNCILNATCALVGAEDIPDFQKELLTSPAKCGGWSLPALNLIKECAFVGGSAATPCIQLWDIPNKYTHDFMAKRTREIEKAIQNLSEAQGINIGEETNLTPGELARGGFSERKTQKI